MNPATDDQQEFEVRVRVKADDVSEAIEKVKVDEGQGKIIAVVPAPMPQQGERGRR